MAQSQLECLNFKKDAFIIVEGDQKADRFFIIRQGTVRIVKDIGVIEGEKDVLVPGDFFGEVAAMSTHSRIETAQAVSDVSVISIKVDQYGDVIQNNTNIAMKIIQQFSKRMRNLNEALTKLTLKKSAPEDVSHLFDVAEYYRAQKRFDLAFYAYSKYMEYCPKGERFEAAQEQKSKIAISVNEENLTYKAEGAVRTYPKDAPFFCESEPGDELFIIQKGSVKITKIVEGNEVLLAILKPGDIFGEMAILENKPRSASAIAYDEDCLALAVNRANFETMAKSQPQIISRLTTLLAERIWGLYRQLASTLITEPVGRLYDALLLDLEKKRIDLESKEPYTFNFGKEELIKMVGFTGDEGTDAMRKMLEEPKKIHIREEKLYCPDLRNIRKEVQYYRRMTDRQQHLEESEAKEKEKDRKAAALRNISSKAAT
ncbi:MAG: cyclic nucleotide-binding domain-containing protein [Spirochaetaceae bacterium]|jgi:CRP-like cAMP-binding protein|nr:cyclic nucleotide-binding domain-containing protein [Spirochaetaceae bacterium]